MTLRNAQDIQRLPRALVKPDTIHRSYQQMCKILQQYFPGVLVDSLVSMR